MYAASFFKTGLLSAAALLVTACGIVGGGGGRMIGSGPLVANERPLVPFSEIENNTSANIVLQRGEQQNVLVNAQADVQPYLQTVVKGDKLTISSDKNWNSSAGTNIVITLPELDEITTDGSGEWEARNFSGKRLNIDTEGSGTIRVIDCEYEDLRVTSDGSGNVVLSGRGDELEATLKSSGELMAFDYDANEVKVSTSGSGTAQVSASSTLDIELTGSGNVLYRGNPKLTIEDKGSGEARAEN